MSNFQMNALTAISLVGVCAGALLASPVSMPDGACDEKDPTTGKALIFKDETGIGPIDFSSGQYADHANRNLVEYRSQEEVCLYDLGEYDPETGSFIESNDGFLMGRFLISEMTSLNNPNYNLFPLDPFVSENNDFRWEFEWEQDRQSNANLSQVHSYYYITDFRRNVFDSNFINRLQIDEEKRKNVLYRQFKSDLPGGTQLRPRVFANEVQAFGAQAIFPIENKLHLEFLHKLTGTRKNAWSALYDPTLVVGEYAELVGQWLLDIPAVYPPESVFSNNGWKNNILPAMTDGLSVWAGYRYTGETEVFRNFLYSARVNLIEVACGPDTGFLRFIRDHRGS